MLIKDKLGIQMKQNILKSPNSFNCPWHRDNKAYHYARVLMNRRQRLHPKYQIQIPALKSPSVESWHETHTGLLFYSLNKD